MPSVSVMTTTRLVNPARLLSDPPPDMNFSVAPLADGMFMVVRSRHQPTGIEMRIKGMFEASGVKVFGAVLNDVPISNVESARYHREYYSTDRSNPRRAEVPALPSGRA